ncbi:MAG TPA: hypothetical protein VM870_11735 [Pyrinomonadaceae bacterium]|nr:hypothetical protein [Pyrinomonadaceae bacterium]
MNCPYCARPLHSMGTRCRACRRYIFGWPHYLVFGALALGVVLLLLSLL